MSETRPKSVIDLWSKVVFSAVLGKGECNSSASDTKELATPYFASVLRKRLTTSSSSGATRKKWVLLVLVLRRASANGPMFIFRAELVVLH